MSAHQDPVPGPWRRGAQARALLAWNERQLASVVRVLEGVLARWSMDWGLPTPSAGVVACSPPEPGVAADGWQWLTGAGEGAAWTWSNGGEASQLAGDLFGGTLALSPLLAEIGSACWTDRIDRIRVALGATGDAGASAAPCVPDLSPWSGSVLVSLPGGARVLLGAALVRILVAWADDAGASQAAWSAPTPRVPVDRALAGIALNLQVHLEGCELSVGSLQDLQIGDVLRLQHRVDAPAAVTLPDGAPLFNGFLARTRGRKAVELAPAVA